MTEGEPPTARPPAPAPPSVRRRRAAAGGLRIFFASHAPHLAPCHYRMTLPAGALAAAGHECFVGSAVLGSGPGPVLGALPGNVLVADLDLLVVQPGVGSDWTPVFATARAAGQKVVVDLDDWWWDLQASTRGFVDDGVTAWRDRLRAMLCNADAVTVATPFLAERIGAWADAPPITLVRNALDLERWGPPENVEDGPVLGYAGSLSGHAEDVALLRPWLGAFVERHDLRVIHVGGHPSHPSFAETAGVDPARVTVRPGRAWADYAASGPMAQMDIGLVPLEDRPYNRAKSALKGMEYGACGVPWLASPSPEYRWLGCGGLAGSTLADQSPSDWVAALEALLDPSARAELAAAQLKRIGSEAIDVRAPDWERCYLEVCRPRTHLGAPRLDDPDPARDARPAELDAAQTETAPGATTSRRADPRRQMPAGRRATKDRPGPISTTTSSAAPRSRASGALLEPTGLLGSPSSRWISR